ncbi:MAG: DUF1684 domain-containing protein [Chloroflexota bacterium]
MTNLDSFSLVHWRRTVAEMYADVRRCGAVEPQLTWERFWAARDDLFANHAQTPLSAEQRQGFQGVPRWDYNPAYRVMGRLDKAVEADTFESDLPEGRFSYTRVGRVQFELEGKAAQLSLFWINAYGGGLFLPFRDATNGQQTYGGGRYLYDTIKGADLGAGNDEIVLDFNYAYHPSCAYQHIYTCPLSPAENKLPLAIEAGEMSL